MTNAGDADCDPFRILSGLSKLLLVWFFGFLDSQILIIKFHMYLNHVCMYLKMNFPT